MTSKSKVGEKEKTYEENLLDRSFNELEREKEECVKNQSNSGSDFFWWSWQSQIDAIDNAQNKLMKLQIEFLLKNYGYTSVVSYIEKLKQIALKEAELDKLKNN